MHVALGWACTHHHDHHHKGRQSAALPIRTSTIRQMRRTHSLTHLRLQGADVPNSVHHVEHLGEWKGRGRPLTR